MDEQKIKTQFEKLKRVERTQKRESTQQRGCGAAWQPLRRKTSLDYTLIAGITLEVVYYTIKYEMVGAAASFLQHSHIQYIHHPTTTFYNSRRHGKFQGLETRRTDNVRRESRCTKKACLFLFYFTIISK